MRLEDRLQRDSNGGGVTMGTHKAGELRARLDSVSADIHALGAVVTPDAVRAKLGEPQAREIDRLSDPDAAEFLRSADESRVLAVLALLMDRLDRDTLAGVCFHLMGQPGHNARLAGVLGIGFCLKRTYHKEASRALAIVARDQDEVPDVRHAAYVSLELVNWGAAPPPTTLAGGAGPTQAGLEDVDWAYVDGFL